jgi:hypothetical protein
MARLETEVNQIYLTHPQGKKTALILQEEQITNSSQLFVLASLGNLQRKSENSDLKKISEIIFESFRINKKLPNEVLFESALSQINQNLADLAHGGRKSWVGQFSAVIALKSSDNIYLANDGATSAWLKRDSELLELLASEKPGTHPLKTFTNFTQGKILEDDVLILTTSNVFNFVSFELFTKLVNQKTPSEVATDVSQILKDSMNSETGFATFFLGFNKKLAVIKSEPEIPKQENELPIEEPLESKLYAPMPEEVQQHSRFKIPSLSALPSFSLPKLNLPNFSAWKPRFPVIKWKFFNNLTFAGKFFLISFSVFVILFGVYLGILIKKSHNLKTQQKVQATIDTLNKDLADASSALIYRNNSGAQTLFAQAQTDYAALQKLDSAKASQFNPSIEAIKDQINKITTITNPKVLVELKHHPIYLDLSNIGLMFANQDSNSLSLYAQSNLSDYFLLNSLGTPLSGVTNYPAAGVVVSSADKIYHIDQTLKQWEPIVSVNNANLMQTRIYNNNLYTLNLNSNQIVKITSGKNKYTTTTINTGDLTNARDFALDKDIYILFPDKIIKITGNKPQIFNFPTLLDPITNASKIFIGSNLYILESNKKRVIILNKNGALLNQIYFPNSNSLLDLAVDESARSLYVLDDNKLYQITF